MGVKTDPEFLKALRAARGTTIERVRAAMKTQNQAIKAIKEQLGAGGRTVPEIAAATRLPTAAVMRTIAGLRKYGILTEGPKKEDYYTYELAG
jgi:Fic family protein